jgi:hypothetical protein
VNIFRNSLVFPKSYFKYITPHQAVKYSMGCWCQELVGTFPTSKKLFDFNSQKEISGGRE